MIEFVLLFALGFLAAALVALIVAPVIQRRIVSLTERRMRASVPLSTAEIRAEKDMARAAFAAENARLSVDLKRSRDQLTESVARGARLSQELVAIRADKIAAEATVEERDNAIRELQSQVHERDARITTLTGNFSDAARLAEALKQELAARDDKINRLGAEIEELRIDLVTLDTEAENFKSQIRELRDERNALRDALKSSETVNRDLELRLKAEGERLAKNEAKLASTITALTDRENALERRIAEVERFRRKNRELSDETRAAKAALKEAVSGVRNPGRGRHDPVPPHVAEAGHGSDDDVSEEVYAEEAPLAAEAPEPAAYQPFVAATAPDTASPPPETRNGSGNGRDTGLRGDQGHSSPAAHAADDLSDDEKIERLRARQAALIERLLKADKSGNDAALRREIAIIAAMMVELAASRGGGSSPIHTILRGSEDPVQPGTSEPSLAARARDLITASH